MLFREGFRGVLRHNPRHKIRCQFNKSLKNNGGADETRTRDLLRDRQAF